MEENKKPIYLEEAEKIAGEKLDRYGLTQKQRKQYEKDKKLDKLKKILPILTWIFVGTLTGVVLFFCKPYLSLDKTQIETMNIVVCIVAGICWWGVIYFIFRNKLKNLFSKLLDKIKSKNRTEYYLMPFTNTEKFDFRNIHSGFIRCPICGHKLEVVENETNNGPIYKSVQNSYRYEYETTVHTYNTYEADTPLISHTIYKCSHCGFSFKASYKGEYSFDSKYTQNSHSIIHTNTITPLSENVKMDEEAENILKQYHHTKKTSIT